MNLFNYRRLTINRFRTPTNNFTHTLFYNPQQNDECKLALRWLLKEAFLLGGGREAIIGVYFGMESLRVFSSLGKLSEASAYLDQMKSDNNLTYEKGATYSTDTQINFAQHLLNPQDYTDWKAGLFPSDPDKSLCVIDGNLGLCLNKVINIYKEECERFRHFGQIVDPAMENCQYVAVIALTTVGVAPILLQVSHLSFDDFPSELQFIFTSQLVKKMVIDQPMMAEAFVNSFHRDFDFDTGVVDVQAINASCPLKPYNKGLLEIADFVKIMAFQYHGIGGETAEDRMARISILPCIVAPGQHLLKELRDWYAYFSMASMHSFFWTILNNADALTFLPRGYDNVQRARRVLITANRCRKYLSLPESVLSHACWPGPDHETHEEKLSAPLYFNLYLEIDLIRRSVHSEHWELYQEIHQRWLESKEVGLNAVAFDLSEDSQKHDDLVAQGIPFGYIGITTKFTPTEYSLGVQDRRIEVFSEYMDFLRRKGGDHLILNCFSATFKLVNARTEEPGGSIPYANDLYLNDSRSLHNLFSQLLLRPGTWGEEGPPLIDPLRIRLKERRRNLWLDPVYAENQARKYRQAMIDHPLDYRPLTLRPQRPLGDFMWQIPHPSLIDDHDKYRNSAGDFNEAPHDLTEDLRRINAVLPRYGRPQVPRVHDLADQPHTSHLRQATPQIQEFFQRKEWEPYGIAVNSTQPNQVQDKEDVSIPYQNQRERIRADMNMDRHQVPGLDHHHNREFNTTNIVNGNVGQLRDELTLPPDDDNLPVPLSPIMATIASENVLQDVSMEEEIEKEAEDSPGIVQPPPSGSVEEIAAPPKPSPPVIALSTPSTEQRLVIDETNIETEEIEPPVSSMDTSTFPFIVTNVPQSMQETVPVSPVAEIPMATTAPQPEPVGFPSTPLTQEQLCDRRQQMSLQLNVKWKNLLGIVDENVPGISEPVWYDDLIARQPATIWNHPNLTPLQRRERELVLRGRPIWDNAVLARDRLILRDHLYQWIYGGNVTDEQWEQTLRTAMRRFMDVAKHYNLAEARNFVRTRLEKLNIHWDQPGYQPSAPAVEIAPVAEQPPSTVTLVEADAPEPPPTIAPVRIIGGLFAQTGTLPSPTPPVYYPTDDNPQPEVSPYAVPHQYFDRARALAKESFGPPDPVYPSYFEVPRAKRRPLAAGQVMGSSPKISKRQPGRNVYGERIDALLGPFRTLRRPVSVIYPRIGLPAYNPHLRFIIREERVLRALAELETHFPHHNERMLARLFVELFHRDTHEWWRVVCISEDGIENIVEVCYRILLLIRLLRRQTEIDASDNPTDEELAPFRTATRPTPLTQEERQVYRRHFTPRPENYVIQCPEITAVERHLATRKYTNIELAGSSKYREIDGSIVRRSLPSGVLSTNEWETDNVKYQKLRAHVWSTGRTNQARQEFGPLVDEFFRTFNRNPEIRITASGRLKPSSTELRKLIEDKKATSAGPAAAPYVRSHSTDTRRHPSTSESSRTSARLSRSFRHGMSLRSPTRHGQYRTRKRSHQDDKKDEPKEKRKPPSRNETTSTGSSAEKDDRKLRRPPISLVSVVKKEKDIPSTSTPIKSAISARSASSPRPRPPRIQGPLANPEHYYGFTPASASRSSTSEDDPQRPSTSQSLARMSDKEYQREMNKQRKFQKDTEPHRLNAILFGWTLPRHADLNDFDGYVEVINSAKAYLFKMMYNRFMAKIRSSGQKPDRDISLHFSQFESLPRVNGQYHRFETMATRALCDAWQEYQATQQIQPDLPFRQEPSDQDQNGAGGSRPQNQTHQPSGVSYHLNRSSLQSAAIQNQSSTDIVNVSPLSWVEDDSLADMETTDPPPTPLIPDHSDDSHTEDFSEHDPETGRGKTRGKM